MLLIVYVEIVDKCTHQESTLHITIIPATSAAKKDTEENSVINGRNKIKQERKMSMEKEHTETSMI